MPDWDERYEPGRRGAIISERSKRGSWKHIWILNLIPVAIIGLILLLVFRVL